MRISDWSSDVCSSDLWPWWCDSAMARSTANDARDLARPAARRCGNRGGGATRPANAPRSAVRSHGAGRSEEHTSELQSLMRISYAVFCLKKKKHKIYKQSINNKQTSKNCTPDK